MESGSRGGYATPLVVGNTVYVFARRSGKELMIALDSVDGKTRWETGYPAPYQPSRPAAAHGAGPKATPLFQNGKLYTLGISGIVSAFDASTGKLLWQKPGPETPPVYGAAVSPIGFQDTVIVHANDEGPLTAPDGNNGEVKWIWKGDDPSFASPIIAEPGRVRQIVAVTLHKVVGISPIDGVQLWEYPWVSVSTPSAMTPILHGDTVIVSGQSMGVAALRPSRDGKWAVDVKWKTNEVSMFLSNPVLVGDTLFGWSERSSGQYFALDVVTGQVLGLGARARRRIRRW